MQGSLQTNTGFDNLVYGNNVAHNAIGVRTFTFNIWHGANYTFYDNNFIDNAQQAEVIVSNSTSTYENYLWQNRPWSDYWNNSGAGNYWSDYLPSYPDASQVELSAVWNTPYVVGGDEQDNYPLMNPFNASNLNVQLPSWADVKIPTPLLTPSFPTPHLSKSTGSTPIASPSPAVPELSWLAILPLLLAAPLICISTSEEKEALK